MKVHVSRIHFPVTTLGPGKRIGLWFQGCSIRCPGCISLDTWDSHQGETQVDTVIAELVRLHEEADGLTVSGGEPFDQPEALAAILGGWKARTDKSVLVFTGYEMRDVSPWLLGNRELIDAMVTGPFRSQVRQTRALRGSDNQELHILTEGGEIFRQCDRDHQAGDRRLDVVLDPQGGAWFAGIPARGDLARLRRLMAVSGHRIETSDMVGSVRP